VSDGAGCMHTSERKEVIFLKRLSAKRSCGERCIIEDENGEKVRRKERKMGKRQREKNFCT
jgi:hypothetical protein